MLSNATKQVLRMLIDQLRDPHGRYQHLLTRFERAEIASIEGDLADLTTDAPVFVSINEPSTALTTFQLPDWEYLDLKTTATNEAPAVRRLKVAGGCLYQVAFADTLGKWHPPVFVPTDHSAKPDYSRMR